MIVYRADKPWKVERLQVAGLTAGDRISGLDVGHGTIRYAAGDRNFGRDPSATGAGYIPAPFGGMTTLYDIETNQDVLTTQTPANDGTLQTVGSLGVKVTNVVGFDIASAGNGRNVGYAALQREGESRSGLYAIDLRSGRAYRAGSIGTSQAVETLAVLREGKRHGWHHRKDHKRGR